MTVAGPMMTRWRPNVAGSSARKTFGPLAAAAAAALPMKF